MSAYLPLRGMRIWMLLVCAAMAIACAGLLFPGGAAADSTPGSISGTVTAVETGASVGGVKVSAYPTITNWFDFADGTTSTGADGTYTISGLSPGAYILEFAPDGSGNYPMEWNGDVLDQVDAAPLTVSAGAAITGVDEQLTSGGEITGHVTAAADGTALSGVTVAVAENPSDDGSAPRSVTTDADGGYSVDGLSTGTYTVSVDPVDASDYVPSTTTVAVKVGDTAAGTDFPLAAGGEVSGTVTSAATGAPLGGVTVETFLPSYAGLFTTHRTTTAADGTYTIGGHTAQRGASRR